LCRAAAVGKTFALRHGVTTQEIVDTIIDLNLPLDDRLLRIEAGIIAAVLAETGGNKSKAARRLGIKRSTLGDRITRCGLRQPEQAPRLSAPSHS